MSYRVRLLLVEDDHEEQESWKREVESHNLYADTRGYAISPVVVDSLTAVERAIEDQDFDAAVVDVRLKQSGSSVPNADGNAVVERLLESELAVVALFTGESGIAHPPAWASKVRVFSKGADDGEGTKAVMEWLSDQVPMLRNLRKAERTIRSEMVRLFAHSIWPRWLNWASSGVQTEFTSLALSRHLAAHVHSAMLDDSAQASHPEEWYFIPPIRSGIRTGDILRNPTGGHDVVLTPRCDLADQGAVKYVQVARCDDVSGRWAELCQVVATRNGELEAETQAERRASLEVKLKKARETRRSFTQHDGAAAKHYLPQMSLRPGEMYGPFMVRFDEVRRIDLADDASRAALEKTRVASLAIEFLPSLVQRFGAYVSRIGSPDYRHPD